MSFKQWFNARLLRPGSEFDVDVAMGRLAFAKHISKFGYVEGINTTEAEVWSPGGAYTGFLTAASAVRVKAGGDAEDDDGAVGANSIVVQGLNEEWILTEETLALNGTGASSATTTTFIRVFRSWVADTGAYATPYNTAAITIETTGGVVVASIPAGDGQTSMAIYTVPANRQCFVRDDFINVSSTKAANVHLWQRPNADTGTAPFSSRRLVRMYHGIGSPAASPNSWACLPAKTDVWFTADAVSGTADVSVILNLLETDA